MNLQLDRLDRGGSLSCQGALNINCLNGMFVVLHSSQAALPNICLLLQGAGSSPPVNLANLDGTGADLAQHFAEQRANDKDQAAYLRDNLLPYVQAYCTMLSWQVQSTTGTHELRPQTRVSLIALLRWDASFGRSSGMHAKSSWLPKQLQLPVHGASTALSVQ